MGSTLLQGLASPVPRLFHTHNVPDTSADMLTRTRSWGWAGHGAGAGRAPQGVITHGIGLLSHFGIYRKQVGEVGLDLSQGLRFGDVR